MGFSKSVAFVYFFSVALLLVIWLVQRMHNTSDSFVYKIFDRALELKKLWVYNNLRSKGYVSEDWSDDKETYSISATWLDSYLGTRALKRLGIRDLEAAMEDVLKEDSDVTNSLDFIVFKVLIKVGAMDFSLLLPSILDFFTRFWNGMLGAPYLVGHLALIIFLAVLLKVYWDRKIKKQIYCEANLESMRGLFGSEALLQEHLKYKEKDLRRKSNLKIALYALFYIGFWTCYFLFLCYV
jgi:hypothetical protein